MISGPAILWIIGNISGGIADSPASLIDSSGHVADCSCVFICDGFGEREASIDIQY